MTSFRTSEHERVWLRGRRYIAGLALADATAIAASLAERSIAINLGWLTEASTDSKTAATNAGKYEELAASLAELPTRTRLEVDLPHIGLGDPIAVQHLRQIASSLPEGRFIQVGAEDSDQTSMVLDTVVAAHMDGVPIRATIQANLRRSPADVSRLTAAGVPIRLVKGGFPEPADRALPYGVETDLAFVELAKQIREADTGLSLATHDPRMHELLWPGPEIEMLLGVRPDAVNALVADGHCVRVFVPFGEAWFDYLAKRVSDAEKAGVIT
jgi:proline dehydrogenase